jgi:NAD-dependent SIR2 family protein deacetylase
LQDGSDLEWLLQQYKLKSDKRETELIDYYYKLIRFADLVYHSAEIPEYIIAFWHLIAELRAHNLRTAIVTLNHDLLVETVSSLISSIGLDIAHSFSYYLDPENCRTITVDDVIGGWERTCFTKDLDSPLSCDPIPILKLHGSFNWILCTSCPYMIASSESLVGTSLLDKPCPSCGSKLKPAVIPPTKAKNFSGLKRVWSESLRILQQASTVFFIGYSLPSYDQETFELFKHNIPLNADIIVISKTVPVDMELRYVSMAGLREINFTSLGFAEFLLSKRVDRNEYPRPLIAN